MNDISIALQLAEHFRQENEGLKRELGRALTEPRIMGSPIISFAGWQVRKTGSPDAIEVTRPDGECFPVYDTDPLFDLIEFIAEYTS